MLPRLKMSDWAEVQVPSARPTYARSAFMPGVTEIASAPSARQTP